MEKNASAAVKPPARAIRKITLGRNTYSVPEIVVGVLLLVPSIVFAFTNNSLIQSFGGTSILIMVGFLMFGRKANPAALTAIDRNDRFADY